MFSDTVSRLYFSLLQPLLIIGNNYNVIKCKFIRLHYTYYNVHVTTCMSIRLHYIVHHVFTLSVWLDVHVHVHVCSLVVKKKGDMNRNTPNKNIICIILCIYNPLSKNILRTYTNSYISTWKIHVLTCMYIYLHNIFFVKNQII